MAEISRQGVIIAGIIILMIVLFLVFSIYGSGAGGGDNIMEGMLGSWFH